MSAVPPQLVADRYRLIEPLGQGGMGRVWKARDEVLHRDVAIKELVPPPGLTNQERREMQERSLREARAIARLNHINVVRVFDVLRTDGDPWIVMEYVPSRSLQDVLAQDGPVSPARAAGIGLGVLGALRSAHRSGVMHRDVKPGNVLLGDDGRVVLTDFGLATVPGDPNVTRTGLVLGSPAYIAPERARTGSAGPEGDLWSLGATLYAAVEGQSPYARPTAIATLSALATEPPPPARRAGPLKPVLTGLLRKDPLGRMKADEAERLLARAAGHHPRRGRSLLDGARRPSPFGPRESRSPFVPGPRPGSEVPPTGQSPSEPVPPHPVAPLPSALPVVPGPARYAPASSQAEAAEPADPTMVVSPAKPVEPASETTVLPDPPAKPREQPATEQPATEQPAGTSTPAAPPAAPPEVKKTLVMAAPAGATAPAGAEPGTSEPGTSDASTAEPATATAPWLTPPPGQSWSTPALLFDTSARLVNSAPRKWLLGAAAGLLILILVLTVAALGDGGPEGQRRGQIGVGPGSTPGVSPASPESGASPTSPGTSTPATTSNASPVPSPATGSPANEPTRPPGQSTDLPDGWRIHQDPTGFSLPVPEGWTVTWDGTLVYFREPANPGRLIIIDQTDEPKLNPVADWQAQERARRGSYRDYERVRIEAVDYFLNAADWEFRYTSGSGNRLQVRNRGFVTAPNKAYSIYWSTTAERWQQDLQLFDLMAEGFQPG